MRLEAKAVMLDEGSHIRSEWDSLLKRRSGTSTSRLRNGLTNELKARGTAGKGHQRLPSPFENDNFTFTKPRNDVGSAPAHRWGQGTSRSRP